MKQKKQSGPPLHSMLKAIDTNQLDFYEKLTDSEQKGWSAWTAMRWASSVSGTSTYHYLLMVNSLVNTDFNTLRHHPNLQWKLLSVCGVGHTVKHTWIAPPKQKKKSKVLGFLLERFPESNPKDLEQWSRTISAQRVKELAIDWGMDPKDIKQLVDE